jgi:hypothetical protein
MKRWEKRQLKLPAAHGWRAKEGCNVFVADRGAVRLDFPEDWIVKPAESSIRFHDREPPDDRCVIEVSYLRLRPMDAGAPSVLELLKAACRRQGCAAADHEIARTVRPDLELVWAEYRMMDPAERRPAVHRICMARTTNALIPDPRRKGRSIATRPTIQALITAAFWPEDAGWFDRAWENVLGSLQLGVPIDSPSGPTHH